MSVKYGRTILGGKVKSQDDDRTVQEVFYGIGNSRRDFEPVFMVWKYLDKKSREAMYQKSGVVELEHRAVYRLQNILDNFLRLHSDGVGRHKTEARHRLQNLGGNDLMDW